MYTVRTFSVSLAVVVAASALATDQLWNYRVASTISGFDDSAVGFATIGSNLRMAISDDPRSEDVTVRGRRGDFEGTIYDLLTGNGQANTPCKLWAMNSSGVAVGWSSFTGATTAPCFWLAGDTTQNRTAQRITVSGGGSAGEAFAINADGWVIGYVGSAQGMGGGPQPFVLSPGNQQGALLDVLGSDHNGQAVAINGRETSLSQPRIIGWDQPSSGGDRTPILWDYNSVSQTWSKTDLRSDSLLSGRDA